MIACDAMGPVLETRCNVHCQILMWGDTLEDDVENFETRAREKIYINLNFRNSTLNFWSNSLFFQPDVDK